MSLRVRFLGPTGSSYSYTIERLADGLLYDFAASAFSAAPATPRRALPENLPKYPGQYLDTFGPTPTAQFADGEYAVGVVDGATGRVVGQLAAVLYGGDDAPALPLPLAHGQVIGTPSATAITLQGTFPAAAGVYKNRRLYFSYGAAQTGWTDPCSGHTVPAAGQAAFTFAQAQSFVPAVGDVAAVMGG